MATVRRSGARTNIALGDPAPFMRNTGTKGLEFCFSLMSAEPRSNGRKVNITLSEHEWDMIAAKWALLRKEFEG